MMFYISFIQVNIVPVIAKADTLTQEECTKFKKQVPLAGTLVLWRNFNLELIKLQTDHFDMHAWFYLCSQLSLNRHRYELTFFIWLSVRKTSFYTASHKGVCLRESQ